MRSTRRHFHHNLNRASWVTSSTSSDTVFNYLVGPDCPKKELQMKNVPNHYIPNNSTVELQCKNYW